MIGLENNTVSLIDYCSDWQNLYAREEKQLLNKLVMIAEDIEHIGSTSVPRIKAKPIIDIMVAAGNKELFLSALKPLLELGYRFIGNGGRKGRLFFVKGSDKITFYHLHLMERDSHYWSNYIFFRDYLRENKEIAKEYEELKVKLSEQYSNDREKYSRYKSRFVKEIVHENKDIDKCKKDDYYQIYRSKSLFLQRYMDSIVQGRKGQIFFAEEVFYRAMDFYNYNYIDYPYYLDKLLEHLNSKFTLQELDIICEEQGKTIEENIRILETVNSFK